MRVSTRVCLALVLVMVLAAAAPVDAQTVTGYVRLVPMSQANNGSAVRDAFQRLLPTLVGLQQKGGVSGFRPLFSVGLVEVRYAASATLSGLQGKPVFRSLEQAIAGRPAPRRRVRLPDASGTRFEIEMDGCYYGEVLGEYSQIFATVYDQRGKAIAKEQGRADRDGELWDCFEDLHLWGSASADEGSEGKGGYGYGGGLMPGYRLEFKIYQGPPSGGDADGMAGPELLLLSTYGVTVPTFGVTSIDKANAILRGVAPKNRPYWVYWDHENLDVADTDLEVEKEGVTSAAGTWSRDMGTVKMRGWDYIEFYFSHTARFDFVTWMNVPASYCWAGVCQSANMPFETVSLVMTRGGSSFTVPPLFAGSAGGWQVYLLKDGDGVPVYIAPGDVLAFGTRPSVTVPTITATISHSRDQIRGTAPHPALMENYLRVPQPGGGWWGFNKRVLTRAPGEYVFDYRGSVDLVHGQVYSADIEHTNRSTGNVFGFRFARVNPR